MKTCAALFLALTLLASAEPSFRIGDPARSDASTRYFDKDAFRQLVEHMPKTELHTHLEGAVRPDTILELAQVYNIELGAANVEELKKKIQMRPGENLLDFLKKFDPFRFVFDHPESLRRVAYEMVEEEAREGVVYSEIRINPVKREDVLSIEGVLDAVLEGMQQASEDYGIESRLIVSLNRSYPLESAMRVARAAAARKDRGVVAMDLAGDEVHHPASKFKEVFDYAQSQGLHITIHAGEAVGPDSIRQALEVCHAERIGHGVRLGEDPAVLEEVARRRATLEMCPSSNLLINVVKDLKSYPLMTYAHQGIPVTISTDDRHIFDLTLTGEYLAMAEQCGLSLQDLEKISLNGIRSSFLPEREKARVEARWRERMDALRSDFALEP
ncbi:MAG: adenosine deaminase [Candidatus Eremiobacteraeota bacterium]|nr:adenosine deaminase [Candidatus Eremiobacteraeota bacterium]MCW5867305.1 adenosine deaminase [Candidatus Eremiobacteraeota bacterium]